jgi:hypothetical protein
MKDVDSLIYNELVAMRQDLKDYMERTDRRILSLEKFKEKAMGVCLCVGVGLKCAWDYIVERIV